MGASPRARGADGWQQRTEPLLSTDVTVLLPPGAPAEGFEQAFRAVAAVGDYANEWRPGSPLAQLNDRAGADVAVPPPLEALLRQAVGVAAVTDGAFDPTWAALAGLWDFREGRIPSQAALAGRLPLVDYRRVRLGPGHARLGPGQRVGLGAIAKGWALDRAADALLALGIKDALLLAGGQVLGLGTRDGAPWRVGLENPRPTPDAPLLGRLVLAGARESVSTSADTVRYFERDGVRYAHILDPRTGWPARLTRSATVVARDAAAADALSTACYVLGPAACLARVASAPGVRGVVIVDDQGAVQVSPGLALAP